MINRRTFTLGTAATLELLPFTAISAQSSAKPNFQKLVPGRRGGTLTMMANPEPTTLVSAYDSGSGIAAVSTKMAESLFGMDMNFGLTPELATTGEWSTDGLTFTVKIQPNVLWHDGTPMTSADVQFSMMKVWKVVHSYGRSGYANVVAVETPDSHTAHFKLSKPAKYMTGLMNAYLSPVMPKHIYDGRDIATNPANIAPIGTGAYRFKEWKKGEYLILERNEKYWRPNRPYLDSIVVRFIPDAGARTVAFSNGTLELGGFNPLPLTTIREIERQGKLTVYKEVPNFLSPMFMLELNIRKPPFNNLMVRQAVLHAIDRQKLIDVVWSGFGKVATGPVFSTMSKFYTKDVKQYPFDIARANALLDQAGFKKNADGKRFSIYHDFLPYGSNLENSAQFVKQNLSKVGIDVQIRSQDIAGFLKRVYKDYDFDMTNNHLSTMPDPTLGVQRLYWSKNIVPGTSYSNASGYSNPEMDRLLEAAQIEPSDDERRKLFIKVQQLAQEDLPILDLFELHSASVTSSSVQNYAVRPDWNLAPFPEIFLNA